MTLTIMNRKLMSIQIIIMRIASERVITNAASYLLQLLLSLLALIWIQCGLEEGNQFVLFHHVVSDRIRVATLSRSMGANTGGDRPLVQIELN